MSQQLAIKLSPLATLVLFDPSCLSVTLLPVHSCIVLHAACSQSCHLPVVSVPEIHDPGADGSRQSHTHLLDGAVITSRQLW